MDRIEDGCLGEMVVMADAAKRAGFGRVEIAPEDLLSLLREVSSCRQQFGDGTLGDSDGEGFDPICNVDCRSRQAATVLAGVAEIAADVDLYRRSTHQHNVDAHRALDALAAKLRGLL